MADRITIGDVTFQAVRPGEFLPGKRVVVEYLSIDTLKQLDVEDKILELNSGAVRGIKRLAFWKQAHEAVEQIPMIVSIVKDLVPRKERLQAIKALNIFQARVEIKKPLKRGKKLEGKFTADEVFVAEAAQEAASELLEILAPRVSETVMTEILATIAVPMVGHGGTKLQVRHKLEALETFGMRDFFMLTVFPSTDLVNSTLRKSVFFARVGVSENILWRFPMSGLPYATAPWVVFSPALFRCLWAIQNAGLGRKWPGANKIHMQDMGMALAKISEGNTYAPIVFQLPGDPTWGATIESVGNAVYTHPLTVRLPTRFSQGTQHMSALELALCKVMVVLPGNIKAAYFNYELLFQVVFGRSRGVRRTGPGATRERIWDRFESIDALPGGAFDMAVQGLQEVLLSLGKLRVPTSRELLRDYSFIRGMAQDTVNSLISFTIDQRRLAQRGV